MDKWIRAFCAAGLLALSGNAAAIMIDDQVYGMSSYSLADIDHAIQAFEDQAIVGTNGNRRKPRHNLDQKIKLLHKLDEYIENLSYAMHSGQDADDPDMNSGSLIRSGRRLPGSLSGFLPEIVPIPEEDGGNPTPQLTALLQGVDGPPGAGTDGYGSSGTGSITAAGQGLEASQVPEPPMLALLLPGFSALLLPSLKRRR